MSTQGGPESTPPAEHVHVDLPQDQRAPSEARRAARAALTSWRLPELVDAVALAVSELVTNAIRYGRPTVSVDLARQRSQVRVAVHDGDPTEPPAAGQAEADAESGRGLAIVEALADDVVVEQIADDGKVVRVDFEAPPTAQP